MSTNASIADKKRDDLIFNSNELIQKLRHNLTLQEQRIFCLLLSKIQRYDIDFYRYEFTLEEFAQDIGISMGGKTRKSIEKAVLNMSSKKFWHKLRTERNGKMLIGFLQDGSVVDSKSVSLMLSSSLKPFLLGMYDNHGNVIKPFTAYALKLVSSFSSRCSLPLYEYLRSEQFKKRKWESTLTVEECKDLLGVDQSRTWGNFYKDSLDIPVSEINKISDIIIKMVFIKTGRTITSIQFNCEKKADYSLTEYIKEDLNNPDYPDDYNPDEATYEEAAPKVKKEKKTNKARKTTKDDFDDVIAKHGTVPLPECEDF